jgi:hypothetical protein
MGHRLHSNVAKVWVCRLDLLGGAMRTLVGSSRKAAKLLAAAALLAACGLLAPSRASADTIFDLTGTFTNGDTFASGSTVTINTTTGYVDTASITVVGKGYDESFTGAPLAPLSQTNAVWDGSLNDVLALLALPPDYWTNFAGGPNLVIDGGLNVNGIVAGVVATLTDPPGPGSVATPEPSSIALLSIGVLALMGMAFVRRRGIVCADARA